MTDLQFFSTVAVVMVGIPFIAWLFHSQRRKVGALASTALSTFLLIMFLNTGQPSVSVELSPQLEHSSMNDETLRRDRRFVALIALWLIALPFLTWPLSEPPRRPTSST